MERSVTARVRRAAVAALAAGLGVVGLAGVAQAKGEDVGGSGTGFFLVNDALTGTADHHFSYGRTGDRAYVGDWDGDGGDTLGVRRGSQYFLRNTLAGGPADVTFAYGRTTDTVLVGDWDGDGDDTLAVRRGNVYHVKNSLTGGPADVVIAYGRTGDAVLVGDWDGDGTDTLAVRRGNVYHVKNSLTGGPADTVVAYGRVSDPVLVGDWDGDGDDTLAVRRGNVFHLRNSLTSGPADRQATYGRAGDAAFVGDWDANGTDTLGVRRGSCGAVVGTTQDQSSGTNPFTNLSSIVGSSINVGEQQCFDRVTFVFRGSGPVPGWTARYVDVIRNEETGEPVQPPFEGTAAIKVTFGAWSTGEPLGEPPFSGPRRILPGFEALREVRTLGAFEGVSDLGLGVDRVRPFLVRWSSDPVSDTTRMDVLVYTG